MPGGVPDLLEGSLAQADRAGNGRRRAVATACARSSAGCTEEVLHSSIRIPPAAGETEPTYVCQNTQIKFATQPLSAWDLRQYLEDYTSGNVGLVASLRPAFSTRRGGLSPKPASASARRCAGSTTRSSARSADRRIRCGRSACPRDAPTPRATARSAGGRARSRQALLRDPEDAGLQLPESRPVFRCRDGAVYRARIRGRAPRQKQIIDERSGKMLRFKTDAIVLKDVVCEVALCDLPPVLPARDPSRIGARSGWSASRSDQAKPTTASQS